MKVFLPILALVVGFGFGYLIRGHLAYDDSREAWHQCESYMRTVKEVTNQACSEIVKRAVDGNCRHE